ncbi:hypothetical protein ACFM35_15960 [Microbacterium sp. P01]|uniref:hypothetical protein n=1 Tax=Microbacterium sp. P01 TaxID=3366261 RepID=UPI003671F865
MIPFSDCLTLSYKRNIEAESTSGDGNCGQQTRGTNHGGWCGKQPSNDRGCGAQHGHNREEPAGSARAHDLREIDRTRRKIV